MGNSLLITDEGQRAMVDISHSLTSLNKKLGKNKIVRPQDVEKRIQKFLPGDFEQKVYLEVASSYQLRAYECANILEIIGGSLVLHDYDDKWVEVGEGLQVNKAERLRKDLLTVLELSGDTIKDLNNIDIDRPTAAALVMIYGDQAERLIFELEPMIFELNRRFRFIFLDEDLDFEFVELDTDDQDSRTQRSIMRNVIYSLVRIGWDDQDQQKEIQYDYSYFVERIQRANLDVRKRWAKEITWKEVRKRYSVEE